MQLLLFTITFTVFYQQTTMNDLGLFMWRALAAEEVCYLSIFTDWSNLQMPYACVLIIQELNFASRLSQHLECGNEIHSETDSTVKMY